MSNIFENTYFGKIYKTKDDIKLIYIGPSIDKKRHYLMLESNKDIYDFDSKGHRECGDLEDIEEYLEEISEEELEELVIENTHEKYYYTLDEKGIKDFQTGFKAGYRYCKSKEL